MTLSASFWCLVHAIFPSLAVSQSLASCPILTLPVPSLPDDTLRGWEKWEQFGVELPVRQVLQGGKAPCFGFAAPGAVSLSLNFGPGSWTRNGRVVVRNSRWEVHQVLPAALWHRRDIWPATLPCYGDTLYVALEGSDSAWVEVNSVVFGYRDWQSTPRGFGDSGPCNQDVNCGFPAWTNEKRSVVLMLTAGNTRKCSGALINNTAQDGRPLLLTARHCNVQSNNIYLFNYESPGCEDVDGPLHQFIQGGTILAQWAPSDFTLVELSEPPPADFYPFYAGWNRTLVLPDSGVTGIHHPRGDVKKISQDLQSPLPAPYLGVSDTTRNHWHVAAWDSGTTEPVSSGSPLFDAQHHIIGQLHGGQASCNFNFNDFYGMLYHSWTGGGTPATSLQPWLDPLGTAPGQWNGLDPYQPVWNKDIGFLSPSVDLEVCENDPAVMIQLRNFGFDTVPGLRLWRVHPSGLELLLDTILQLPYSQIFATAVPVGPLEPGELRKEIWIAQMVPQGDENPLNDSLQLSIRRLNGEKIKINIFSDAYPSETGAFVLSRQGDTLWKAPPLASQTLNSWTLCLPFDCYELRVTDSGGDGLCCQYGAGFVEVEDARGRIMGRLDQFQNVGAVPFCIPFAEESTRPLTLFPVPARDVVMVLVQPDGSGNPFRWRIVSSEGRVVAEGVWDKYFHTFDISGLASGVYLFTIWDEEKRFCKKFVKL